MTLRVGKIGIVSLLAAATLLAAGCTGTDPLRSGNTTITVEFDRAPLTGRFEAGLVEIAQILLLPTVDSAAGALGTSTLGLLRGTEAIQLIGEVQQPITVPLSAGTYEVLGVNIQQISLTDVEAATSGFTTCYERLIPARAVGLGVISGEDATGQPVYLDVREDGSTKLTVRIDGDGIAQAVFDSALGCTSQQTVIVNIVDFRDAAPSYLTIATE